MRCEVRFKSSVAKDLKQIDPKVADNLLRQLKETLSENPNAGELSKGQFSGMYKLRLGEYRAVYARVGNNAVVVLRIGHRSKVYVR